MGEVIKAGELVLVTSGEYSDYQVIGVFRATQDFNVREQVRDFRGGDDSCAFFATLSTGGLLEELDLRDLYIGSYNSLRTLEIDGRAVRPRRSAL